jgi:hypothetical protein
MITVKVLLGKDTVSIYRKTGDISSVESTAESGGYVITRHFETEAEYKAYAMAVEEIEPARLHLNDNKWEVQKKGKVIFK